jgi:hypothetical protein
MYPQSYDLDMRNSHLILVSLAVVAILASPACTTIVRPAISGLQSLLKDVHVKVSAGAEAYATVNSQVIVLDGRNGNLSFEMTAPLLGGVRQVVLSRSVEKGAWGAWAYRIFDRDGDRWIKVERVSCEAATELLSGLDCPAAPEGLPDVAARAAKRGAMKPDVVERQLAN